MKRCLLFVALMFALGAAKAQKVDSIYFNLYTDSLKKGTYNYINIDGKLADGRWLPMTTKEVILTASSGKFDGNSLFLDTTFREPKVTIKATLKENPAITREVTIYIKTTFVDEKLKTAEELMEEWKKRPANQTKKKKSG